MSRFVINRTAIVSFVTVGLLAGSLSVSAPAQASSDWGDILKPLVKEVLIPGASKGLKIWQEKRKASKENTSEEGGSDTVSVDTSGGEEVHVEEVVVDDVTEPTPDGGDMPPQDSASGETVIMVGSGEDAPPPPPPEPTP